MVQSLIHDLFSNRRSRLFIFAVTAMYLLIPCNLVTSSDYTVTEDSERIHISTPQLEAAITKQGYVSGVVAQSFLDKQTGFRDPGFGLDIVDWIMEPVKPGESFSAAFVVGYFDSVEEMNRVYDLYKGHTALEVKRRNWKLVD